jgi:hypothetical protein
MVRDGRSYPAPLAISVADLEQVPQVPRGKRRLTLFVTGPSSSAHAVDHLHPHFDRRTPGEPRLAAHFGQVDQHSRRWYTRISVALPVWICGLAVPPGKRWAGCYSRRTVHLFLPSDVLKLIRMVTTGSVGASYAVF